MSKLKFVLLTLIMGLFLFSSCQVKEVNLYNPESKIKKLKREKGGKPAEIHFLVFGDSKGSVHFPDVLKRANSLQLDFCITTADLVNKGGGEIGVKDYKKLDSMGG
jgi:hypothetical protein